MSHLSSLHTTPSIKRLCMGGYMAVYFMDGCCDLQESCCHHEVAGQPVKTQGSHFYSLCVLYSIKSWPKVPGSGFN